jgi:hypothetical protein
MNVGQRVKVLLVCRDTPMAAPDSLSLSRERQEWIMGTGAGFWLLHYNHVDFVQRAAGTMCSESAHHFTAFILWFFFYLTELPSCLQFESMKINWNSGTRNFRMVQIGLHINFWPLKIGKSRRYILHFGADMFLRPVPHDFTYLFLNDRILLIQVLHPCTTMYFFSTQLNV